MSNVEMLKDVQERMNFDKNGNPVLFPVDFESCKRLYTELDEIDAQIIELYRLKAALSRKADDEMEKEYLKNEDLRMKHEFLSQWYHNVAKGEIEDIGDGVVETLHYCNSKAIKDDKGRWFATIREAAEYHNMPYATLITRLRAGYGAKECFSTKNLPRGRGAGKAKKVIQMKAK